MMNNNHGVPHVNSIRNTAADFGIGEWTIRQWVKQGKFPVISSGREIRERVHVTDVCGFVSEILLSARQNYAGILVYFK